MPGADLSKIYLPDKIGSGYGTMWRFKGRYVAVKGSRRSKKSSTQAQKIIYQIVKYPLSNALVVRRYYNTLRDSCYAQLRWAISNLGLEEYFVCKESPLEITYTPTGQKILFRGLDDPLKITSITMEKGVICWLWIEEAYELEEESDFNKLEESLMGSTPDGHYKQITLTFNPWSESTWIKARFFDREDPNVLAITTTYKCNEWLSDDDKAMFEDMRLHQPERYRVSGLGDWGVDGAVYFEEFRQDIHVCTPFAIPDHWKLYRSIDYGLDALACLYVAVDTQGVAYVIGETYAHGLKISDAARAILDGEPKSLTGGRDFGNFVYAPPDLWSRTKDSGIGINETFFQNGVMLTKSNNARVPGWLQVHERLRVIDDVDGGKTAMLKIFSTCKNLIRCISTIKADEDDINDCATEPHELTHLPDALRYFCIQHQVSAREPDTRTAEDKMLAAYKEAAFGHKQSKMKVIRGY